ncbi:MAG: toll/interleukin-1 receptor domain-containing protein [Candidatus Eremiobacteraeota bacterium]|nr:toll/interleukin-1 receptor domain-containing protein [Candidatus Eremiobacteraeota bacterium]
MYDVFISCKSEDFPLARQLHEYLWKNRFRVFFSEFSLPQKGTAAFRENIDEALDASEHLIVVASSAEHLKSRWVKAEWGAFVNEVRSGRKDGNVVTIIFGDVEIKDMPLALRQYEVLKWEYARTPRLLSFLAPVQQEIFRIDTRDDRIYWGRRPTTHKDLKNITNNKRIDGDKKGRVVRVWKSSYNDRKRPQCNLAARIILKNREAAEGSRINLSGVVIEDNNGVILYPR